MIYIKKTFCNSLNIETFHYIAYNGFYEDNTDDTRSFGYRLNANKGFQSSILNSFCESRNWNTQNNLYQQQSFCLSKGGLCIMIHVQNGDILEYEAKYDNLKEHINKDNALWVDIY